MDRVNGTVGAAASRAERFEDEKRRIVESCFGRRDTDGSRKFFHGYENGIGVTLEAHHKHSSPRNLHNTYSHH